MNTPRNTLLTKKVRKFGEYAHFGLKNGLVQLWSRHGDGLLINIANCAVFINFDELPINKCNFISLWSISCSLKEIKDEPFIIGSYCGTKEPSSVSVYLNLDNFIKKANELSTNEFIANECSIPFCKLGYICDVPARSLANMIKSHIGYFSCEKCEVEGDYINNRVSFLDLNACLRTDERFASGKYNDHCKNKSPLLGIPGIRMANFLWNICI